MDLRLGGLGIKIGGCGADFDVWCDGHRECLLLETVEVDGKLVL